MAFLFGSIAADYWTPAFKAYLHNCDRAQTKLARKLATIETWLTYYFFMVFKMAGEGSVDAEKNASGIPKAVFVVRQASSLLKSCNWTLIIIALQRYRFNLICTKYLNTESTWRTSALIYKRRFEGWVEANRAATVAYLRDGITHT